MSFYDMSAINEAPDEGMGRQPGVYRVVVSKVDERTSQNGNAMLNLALCDADNPERLVCFDRLMLHGKTFALTLTKGKLKTLGMPLDGPLDPVELNGRRCWVAVVFGKPNKDGKVYLEVNINAPGSKFGYYPDSPERPGTDESQATSLIGQTSAMPAGRTAPWPAGVKKSADLPEGHPDWTPF